MSDRLDSDVLAGSFAHFGGPAERYRYLLGRELDGSGPPLLFVMLNPSVADGHRDDVTIRRCIGYARREGARRLLVANLFAWRAQDPDELVRAAEQGLDVVGPENDAVTWTALEEAGTVVFGWGAHAARRQLAGFGRPHRVAYLARKAGRRPLCLGTTAGGHPGHPRLLRKDAELVRWREPSP